MATGHCQIPGYRLMEILRQIVQDSFYFGDDLGNMTFLPENLYFGGKYQT
jgi:hypothetical protein